MTLPIAGATARALEVLHIATYDTQRPHQGRGTVRPSSVGHEPGDTAATRHALSQAQRPPPGERISNQLEATCNLFHSNLSGNGLPERSSDRYPHAGQLKITLGGNSLRSGRTSRNEPCHAGRSANSWRKLLGTASRTHTSAYRAGGKTRSWPHFCAVRPTLQAKTRSSIMLRMLR